MSRRSLSCAVMVLGVLLGLSSSATNQQPPEAPLPPPMPRRHPPSPPSTPQDQAGVANQINRIQDRLAQYTPTGMAEKKIFAEACNCLQRARKQLSRNQIFTASRLAGAAEELSHALDRLQRRGDPAEATSPPCLDLHRHLIEVYFRVRQADYFYQQSRDKRAQTLAELARRFYQQARQAFDQQHPGPAIEYADAADDMVRALEFLAQSAVKANAPPPLAIGRKR